VVEVFLGSIYSLFVGFLSSLKRGKKFLKGIMIVWHADIWVLWRVRNDKIFLEVAGEETRFSLFVLRVVCQPSRLYC
jgi:hypothetical protein